MDDGRSICGKDGRLLLQSGTFAAPTFTDPEVAWLADEYSMTTVASQICLILDTEERWPIQMPNREVPFVHSVGVPRGSTRDCCGP